MKLQRKLEIVEATLKYLTDRTLDGIEKRKEEYNAGMVCDMPFTLNDLGLLKDFIDASLEDLST